MAGFAAVLISVLIAGEDGDEDEHTIGFPAAHESRGQKQRPNLGHDAMLHTTAKLRLRLAETPQHDAVQDTTSHHKHLCALDSIGLAVLECPIRFSDRINGRRGRHVNLGRLDQQFATILTVVADTRVDQP